MDIADHVTTIIHAEAGRDAGITGRAPAFSSWGVRLLGHQLLMNQALLIQNCRILCHKLP
jgi:hypothetical protein